MTEYQGYTSKDAADLAAISAAAAEMADLTFKPNYFADNIEIKWRDPSPISASVMADDLARMIDMMAVTHSMPRRYVAGIDRLFT